MTKLSTNQLVETMVAALGTSQIIGKSAIVEIAGEKLAVVSSHTTKTGKICWQVFSPDLVERLGSGEGNRDFSKFARKFSKGRIAHHPVD